MIQRTNQPMGGMGGRNPKLPTQLPKTVPSRKHAISKDCLHTIQNLSDVLVFIWLNNGNQFWFFITYTRPNQLIGHAWNGSQWVNRTLSLQSIWSYY